MILSDGDIITRIEKGEIAIDPAPNEVEIQGASVDLRLGNNFRLFSMHTGSHIDLWQPREQLAKTIDNVMIDEVTIGDDEAFYLHPGELVLGATLEKVTISDSLCGILNGRSSLARLGLMVHATAHFVDPGWSGQIVLEFFNCGRSPLGLKPGMPVCALGFQVLSSPALHPYNKRENAKYRDQHGAVASRIALD
ncbi:MAG: dCTP deaminase [Methyloligellaceae bacterium]